MNITINKIRHYFLSHKPDESSDKKLIRAGVLMPIFQKDGELYVILTKRTNEVEHHKGQISFPGGTEDKSDNTIIDTALRETEEEIGIMRNEIEVLGILSDFCTPSGFCITPVVGFLNSLPPFNINRKEVHEVFDVPLCYFLDPSNERMEQRTIKGQTGTIFFYKYGKYEIWGATAAILRSFLHNLN